MFVAAELVACDIAITAHAAAARAASPQYRFAASTFTAVLLLRLLAGTDVDMALRATIPSPPLSPPPPPWPRDGGASLPPPRPRREASRDIALCHDQHDRGRHHGDDS